MLKTHEIALKIGAIVENTFPKAFSNINSMMSGVKAHAETIRKIQNPFNNMSGNAQELAKTFELAKVRNEVLKNSLSSSQSKTDKLRNSYEQAQQKCKNLHQEIKNSVTPTQKQTNEFQRAIRESDSLKKKWQEARQESRNIRNELKAQSDVVKNLGDNYQNTANKIKFQQKIKEHKEKVSRHLQDAANSMIVARSTLSAANFMIAPIKSAMKFESVMADIRKLVHFDTPQEFAEMGEQLKQLSLRVPMAVDGLGHIAASAAQAGIAKKDIMEFTENAAQMGVAYNITAEQAGDMMAKWRSAFSMNQQQVMQLADQINILSDNSAATGVQIGDVVTRIGSLGKMAGVTQAQLAALAATSIGGGYQSEVAATGIKKFFTVLSGGESVTKSQAVAFSKLGINVTTLAKDFRDKGAPVILDVLRKIKKQAPEKQASMIKQIFGEEAIGPIAAIAENIDQVEKNLVLTGNASNYAGSMLREFTARSATTENTMQLFQNQLAAVSLTIGTTFLPAINDMMKEVNNTLQNSILPWIDSHKEAINILVTLAAKLILAGAGISIMKAALNLIKVPLTVTKGLLSGVFTVLKWFIPATIRAAIATKAQAAAQVLLNIAMKAHPLARAITLLVALGTAVWYVTTHFDEVCGAIKKAWEWVKSFVGGIFEVIGAVSSLFDGVDGKHKVDIQAEINSKNNARFSGNIEALATQQKQTKVGQNITYNAPQTINVTGANPQEVKKATAQASQQAQSNFDDWYKQNRLAY